MHKSQTFSIALRPDVETTKVLHNGGRRRDISRMTTMGPALQTCLIKILESRYCNLLDNIVKPISLSYGKGTYLKWLKKKNASEKLTLGYGSVS
jgi:hypothetical protein